MLKTEVMNVCNIGDIITLICEEKNMEWNDVCDLVRKEEFYSCDGSSIQYYEIENFDLSNNEGYDGVVDLMIIMEMKKQKIKKLIVSL